MKLLYTTADGKLTVELEGKSDKDLFRQLAKFQEVFEDVPSGKVDGKVVTGGNVKYRVRKAKYIDKKTDKEKEAEYFEKMVTSGPLMWYKKSFGVLDDGTDNLFPKSKTPQGCTEGFNGWSLYQGNDKSEEADGPL